MRIRKGSRNLPVTDVAVIGSGIAGLFLALRCFREGLDVTIVTKKAISTSSTNWAQGGIAGVIEIGDEQALESHVQDTLASGGGLCDEEVVRSVVNEAADRISDLVEHGVQFDTISEGKYHLAREGGHSDSRILHSKDRTGAEIERALVGNASDEEETGLRILENWMVLDLIRTNHDDPSLGISGIWTMAPNGTV
ncbi:MAG TPA: FAD-dependent oxidoreductase, partial [Candidatus Thalassarchaeaceae archaeon]|nr:FAD-dependent oxidoreductase [Candidatus Thalassarchaeaceae archaeon]